MSIGPGTRLGPYEIIASIGAGGMGEVFRARDTRLNRTVAIKVLRAAFAGDQRRQLRLQREAQIISQLNHPGICAIYDTGSEDGVDYLVMEYIDGHTLNDRLAHGPMPAEDVLRIGMGIAEALDRAHLDGIVHRDLKPANVMLTKSGVKLLDFGLAMTFESEAASESVTRTRLTEEGTVVGTVQYMAPESLEGRAVDKRADIFALGAILHEMATGVRAFGGETRASIITAILSKPPQALSSVEPPALKHVIARCVEKNPDDRWQSARDVAHALGWAGENASESAPPRPSRRWMSVLLIALIAALLSAAFLFWPKAAQPERARLSLTPPPQWYFGSPTQRPFVVSPDGKHVALMTNKISGDAGARLWIRPIAGEPRPVEGTETARQPFWSADSRSVAFYDEGFIRKVDLAGGSPETIGQGSLDYGASWGSDGTIVFANPTGIYRTSANNSAAKRLVTSTPTSTYFDPVLLPDDVHYLVSLSDAGRSTNVVVRAVGDDSERVVVRNAGNARWLKTEQLLFVRGETLMVQPFNLKRLTVSGEAVVVAPKVGTLRRETMNSLYSASVDGRILALQPSLSNDVLLVQVRPDGTTAATLAGPARIAFPSVTRDGARIACMIEQPNGDADIWTIDRTRGVMMRVTSEPSHDTVPIWSPDGSWIVYTADRAIFRIPSGGGKRERLVTSEIQLYATDWSGDGRLIIFTEELRDGSTDVKALRLSDGNVTPLLTSRFREHWARLSPDGEWLAYQSNEVGSGPQVFVQRFRDGAFKTRISTTSGFQPHWSADGKTIYYMPFMKVALDFRPDGIVASDPRNYLSEPDPDLNFYGSIVLPDGSGVIGRTTPDYAQGTEIDILLNWIVPGAR